jgi:predicted deacylase
MTPMAFFPMHAPVRKAALAVAMALNIGCLVESQATEGEYSYAAASMGIPGLLIERGEGYFCESEWIEADRRDLLLLLEHMGICPAPSGMYDPSLNRRIFREAIYLEAERSGLWYPAVKKDQPVRQGQLLGTLENLFGDVLETVYAEHDGHVLYLNCGLAIPKGELLVAYAVAASLA